MKQLSTIQLINLKLAQDYISDIHHETDDAEIERLTSAIDTLIVELIDYNAKLNV